MLTNDVWLLIKKIAVAVLIFLFPLLVMGGILWLIQFYFLSK